MHIILELMYLKKGITCQFIIKIDNKKEYLAKKNLWRTLALLINILRVECIFCFDILRVDFLSILQCYILVGGIIWHGKQQGIALLVTKFEKIGIDMFKDNS